MPTKKKVTKKKTPAKTISFTVQQNREKWLKALEGRKYKQGEGQLHNDDEDSFCCLGVLCDVMKKQVKGTWQGSHFVTPNEEEYALTPMDVRQLVRMTKHQHDDAITMNDFDDLTFKEIAAKFRKTWKMPKTAAKKAPVKKVAKKTVKKKTPTKKK